MDALTALNNRHVRQGPTTVTANKLAMSRALGAAFLNHQVEQLEKSVARSGHGRAQVSAWGPSGGGSWRERRQAPVGVGGNATTLPNGTGHQSSTASHQGLRIQTSTAAAQNKRAPAAGAAGRKLSDDEGRDVRKDIDVIVVDASVLVHALYQVKRWCKDTEEAVIIVPLEALNTLDLLKKGTTSLAQRARAASRILEAQVGTNPRIRVQRDEAYVYWDKIAFNSADDQSSADKAEQPSPEWVRRTICCARWEVENPNITLDGSDNAKKPRVVLAVLSPSGSSTSPGPSPQSNSLKLSDNEPNSAITPNTPVVPLPAPIPHGGNKFEPRSAGTLVAHWAAKAGIEILEIEAAAPGRGAGANCGNGEEDEGRGGRRGPHGAGGGLVERPPAVMAMMEMVSRPSNNRVVRVLARGEKLDP
ncbi:hypothetical protein AMATHDRAFT_159728 [Amanita thiersii Skay4041]|uniref:PIN domain-containing protein n=1 Tax=Amanita thiersii Skay4041 TaxID=703135 RepID=A0A2A9NCL0_9AGAR|nr:hypothetical protein AMATHDRAFT_159728 [Amanita thiersii Skay4041]